MGPYGAVFERFHSAKTTSVQNTGGREPLSNWQPCKPDIISIGKLELDLKKEQGRMGHLNTSDGEQNDMGADEAPINMTALIGWRDERMLAIYFTCIVTGGRLVVFGGKHFVRTAKHVIQAAPEGQILGNTVTHCVVTM